VPLPPRPPLFIHAIAAALAIAAAAHAQDSAGTPAEDLLAGPKVKDSELAARAKRPTLVVRNFEGDIERSGPEPGEDALRAMQSAGGEWALVASEAKALETVAIARAAALDALLRANYQEIFRLQGIAARAASPSAAARLAAVLELGQVMHAFQPYFDRGGFLDEFARAEGVRAGTVDKAREIEKRYITALVRSEQKREADAGSKPSGELAIRVRLRLEHLGALIRRAIERKVELGEAEFDAFAAALNLDGGMREKVRAELAPLFLAELAGKATPAMRMQAFSRVYAMLDPDQRRALLSYVAERRAR
jgi:hypothetical protein